MYSLVSSQKIQLLKHRIFFWTTTPDHYTTDDFFLMINLPAASVFTFYLFWVKTPLSQHRPALLCSKMEIQISHENEWFDIFFCIFVIHFPKGNFFINYLYQGQLEACPCLNICLGAKIQKFYAYLVYNLLTTEL